MGNEASIAFFEKYAGWAYDPAKETPEQGRRRGAVELAKAEQWAREENITFGWKEDWSVGSHQEFYGEAYSEGEPDTCEVCVAYSPDGEVLASLGCIDGADANYRRVVEAELAQEAMTQPPKEEILVQFTTRDAEAVLGRPLAPGEASSLRRTLDNGMAEEFAGLVEEHTLAERDGEEE